MCHTHTHPKVSSPGTPLLTLKKKDTEIQSCKKYENLEFIHEIIESLIG